MHNNEFSRQIVHFFKLAGEILSIFFWVLLIFGFGDPIFAGLSVIAAFIHEFGHELCLFLSGKGGMLAKGRLFGFKIEKVGVFSYREECLLYASGVISNLVFSVLALPFLPMRRDYVLLFIFVNLATAISNLLPVEGFDGYGILRSLAAYFGKEEGFVRIFSIVSLALITLFCFLSLYMMDRYDLGYWTYAVFSLSLLSKLGKILNLKNRENGSFTENA